MKSLLALALTFASVAVAQNYKAEPAGGPPSDLAPAFASLMSPNGYKISGSSGVFCEVWFRSSLPAGKKSAEDSVAFPTIPYGALIGVIRFPGQAADRRGQQI